MAGLRTVVEGIGLVLLFGIAIIAFATQFIFVNNPEYTSDSFLNAANASFQQRASEMKSIGESTKTLIENAEPSPSFIFLIFKEGLSIPKNFISFLVGGFGDIVGFWFIALFGGSGGNTFYIVLFAINAIILVSVAFMVLRAIRTGETER